MAQPAPRTDAQVRPYLASLGLPGLVDLHVHFMPQNMLDKVWAFFDRVGERGTVPPWTITYRTAEQDRVQTLRQLGVSAFTTLNYAHRPGMAGWLNDYSARFAAENPEAIHSGTFFPESGVAEQVGGCLDAGVRVFKVHVQVGGFTPLDPLLELAWTLLEQAGTPVVIHCGNGPTRGEHTGPGPIRALLARHPRLVLVIAHAGLPEYAEFAALAREYPGVHLDTTMVGTSFMEDSFPLPADYPQTMAELAHKVVLGTDFPNIPYPYAHQIQVLAGWGLGDEWMRQVLWENPRRLVGLDGKI